MRKKKHQTTESHYTAVLKHLLRSKIPFMVGGAFAMREYGNVFRDTKDLDVFCTPGNYPPILRAIEEIGYTPEVRDPDWLAKGLSKSIVVDVIFGYGNRRFRVSDSWYLRARPVKLFGLDLKLIPPEEMIQSKIYVQERDRFDGADINHIILKQKRLLDWKHLLDLMDIHWELLFAALLHFRFVYPGERECVPEWIIRELADRLQSSLKLPATIDNVCRGPVVSPSQYLIDIREWGYRS